MDMEGLQKQQEEEMEAGMTKKHEATRTQRLLTNQIQEAPTGRGGEGELEEAKAVSSLL